MTILIEGTDSHTTDRDALVVGLRELANFAEANPDLPFNYGPEISYCVLADNDADGQTELGRIATILGEPVKRDYDGGHLGVRRRFGGLSYRAYYVMRKDSAEYAEQCKMLDRINAGELAVVPVAQDEPEPAEAVA